MNILITGNMGYVGSVLSTFLRQRAPGLRLIGVDAGYFANCITLKDARPENSMDWQSQGDVRFPSPDLLTGIDIVVHLAAISNDPMGEKFENATESINEHATIQLATMARDAGVKKFIFASSCSVYGAAGEKPRAETDPIAPLTTYARSKVGAEASMYSLCKSDFSIFPLRFATACGGSPRMRLDLVLNDFVASALSSGVIDIRSDGTPWRPLIHVHDMCMAIMWAISEQRHWHGTPINVGSDAFTHQVKDLAAEVAKQTGAEMKINPDAAPDTRSYKVDFDLYKKLAPNHQPVVDLEMAVKDLLNYFSVAGTPSASFKNDSNFVRMLYLQMLVDKGVLDNDLIPTGKRLEQ